MKNLFKQRLAKVTLACAEAELQVSQLLAREFKNGQCFGVRLKYGQKNYSPAIVHGVGVRIYRGYVYPYVRVQLVNAKPRSRNRYRNIAVTDIEGYGE